VTGLRGLYSAFQADRRWFHPQEAEWKIEKINEKELVLDLKFSEPAVGQTWAFSFSDDKTLLFKVEAHEEGLLRIDNEGVHLELGDIYGAWKTSFESGSLSIPQGFEEIYPIRLKNNKVSSVLLETQDNREFPDLSFVALSHKSARVLGLHKRKQEGAEFVCLGSSRIIPKTQESPEGARHLFFEGKIALGGQAFAEEEAPGEVAELSHKGLRFLFDNGRGRVFYGARELTTGLGVYTSLRASHLWLDSFQALWYPQDRRDKKIVLTGHWPHVPVSQTWQIEMTEAGEIAWSVETEIHQDMNLEIEQAGLMLPADYTAWSAAPAHRGDFPEEFTEDYDILPFRSWYGATDRLEAAGRGLPKVIFRALPGDVALRGLVENTDSLYRARLLQYQKANTKKVLPGKYTFFKGVIAIEP